MIESKLDPRIVRTRKLIMDSFIRLSRIKEFNSITIKDITDEATVNRATFYYHFTDKYELLERVLNEDMIPKVIGQINDHNEINEETITRIFISITDFQSSIKTQCMKSFESFKSNIETIIKKEMEQFFYKVLLEKRSGYSEEELKIAAVMLSWGIYGATINWQYHSNTPKEAYIKKAMPFITQGIGFLGKS
ncbi:TetR/AcrR family transcriptional regulator [Bacillus sp. 03113]|uniref:TetR/AcrR family transcriptional regulator n=1 Tax=Bacillus sp. 03113 TaxID=2578211 RepID=UPI001143B559|nr:TetR/AcrR family transcriptional regulator [Bacillus sp. 03113]